MLFDKGLGRARLLRFHGFDGWYFLGVPKSLLVGSAPHII
jgi:hypothetical protein